jgi:DNA-binding beta-propeller fold protein YncE
MTDFGNRTVWVLNTADHSVIVDIDVGGHPDAIAVSPDGEWIYITDYWAGTLTAVEIEPAISKTAGVD